MVNKITNAITPLEQVEKINEIIENMAGGGLPIGSIIQLSCTSDYVPEGTLPCDGAEYTKAQFEQFFTNYLVGGKLNTCAYTQYQSDITTYGQCDKFALDTTNNKFKVPTIADEQISDIADTVPVKGNGITMGLTNGTTEYGLMSVASSGAPVLEPYKNASGITVGQNPTFSADNIGQTLGLSADETKSGVITNTANSKKYLALRYFVVVANGSVNQSMMDWSQWASSLQGKLNADHSNDSKPYIIEVSPKSILPSWYRVWSDGWCEQGGVHSAGYDVSITLLHSFLDTNYNIQLTGQSTTAAYAPVYKTKTATSFTIFSAANASSSGNWCACGYIN